MNEHDDGRVLDVLESATESLRETEVPDGPSQQLAASTVAAIIAQTGPTTTFAPRGRKRRRRLVAASVVTVATVASAVLIALLAHPSPSVGWADVTKAIQSQKWIRGTGALTGGRRGTMWLSPERQIWADQAEHWYRFFDGRERAKYEYFGGAIVKSPLGEEDARRVLPIDALSQDKDAIGPWLFGSVKIVDQERREVMEGGKKWIEFQMVLFPGEANQATLRVDPETRLPVYLFVTSPDDASQSHKWEFDYPEEGPTDIYALGVPRETKIDDRMPSDEAQRLFDAMAASRALIGGFRLMVAEDEEDRIFIVNRKGDRWRVDVCHGLDPREPAVDQAASDWFAELLKRSTPIPLYICDGKTVYRNPSLGRSAEKDVQWRKVGRYVAPQDLMSVGWLSYTGLAFAPYVKLWELVYPDLTPAGSTPFELDRRPPDAPGCVLTKRFSLSTGGTAWHEWCYVDPAKGHAVVRAELFYVPADTPPDPESCTEHWSMRMEDFRQTTNGLWYPTVLRNTGFVVDHEDEMAGRKPTPRTITVYYHMDSDAVLPDSLFTIDDAS